MQTIKAFDPIGAEMLAYIYKAIGDFNHFPSVPYLMPILENSAVVVWDNYCRSAGFDNRAVSYMISALVKLANKYRLDGLYESALVCVSLADKFRSGEITILDRVHLN